MAERRDELARTRRQNVSALLEVLVDQAWLQANEGTKEYIENPPTGSAAVDQFVPRPGSMTEKLWGALGEGTQEELDEVFSYDYEYELSQR